MGLFDDNDDRTEPATPKRLGEARSKGQVARSQELSTAALLIAGLAVLQVLGKKLGGALEHGLRRGLELDAPAGPGRDWAVALLRGAFGDALAAVLPFLGALVLAAIAVGLAQVGFLITFEPFKPDPAKLDPLKGLGRLFSLRTFAKSLFSFAKLFVIAGVLAWNLYGDWPLILLLPELPFAQAVGLTSTLIAKTLWWIALPLLLLALADFAYQKWQFARDMRMTKQEVKDEQKSTEGDPEIKARIKRAQREIARRRMMEEVPKADVVITNPTHFAVALKYERFSMSAPTVVAKGTDRLALRIREIAAAAGVPIWEDPPLARALHRGVRLGEEIPPRFYKAVAAVLAHVLGLEKEREAAE